MNFENRTVRTIKQSALMYMVCVLMFGVFLAMPTLLKAQSGLGTEFLPGNFGGRALSLHTCSCTPGCFLMYVGPPKGGFKLWCPTSLTFMFYVIVPFRWQLGLQGIWIPCMRYASTFCYPYGGGNYIMTDGTSLL